MRKRLFVLLAGFSCAAASANAAQSAAPTWNQDVAPIVFANCITCHRPGEVAPMSLMSYQDARPWAKGIKAKVAARQMPPWFADPRYGKFENKRALTDAQIATIAAWADAGAPQGTGVAPATPEFGARSAEVMTRPPDAIIDGVEVNIPAIPTESYFGFNAWGGKTPWTE